jgi:hypothetical protein
MKNILITTIAALGLSLTVAQAAEYTVFKVCEDQRVLKTSDGADAGHVDYIVVDPGSHQVISTVITGGVLAERHVAIPISSLTFGADRTVTIREITRERIVAAPVIETTRWRESYVVEPSIIERSYTHFGVNVNEINRTSTRTTVEGGPDRVGTRATVGDQTTTERTKTEGRVGTPDAPDRTRTSKDAPDRTGATTKTEGERTKAGDPANRKDAPAREGAGARTEAERSKAGEPANRKDAPARDGAGARKEGTTTTDPAGKRGPEAKPDAANKEGAGAEKPGTKRASEKSSDQPEKKSDRTGDKAPPKSEAGPERAPAKSEASAEKAPAKPETTTDKPASKPEGNAEKNQGGRAKKSERGESKGAGNAPRKAGDPEGSTAAPASEKRPQ